MKTVRALGRAYKSDKRGKGWLRLGSENSITRKEGEGDL